MKTLAMRLKVGVTRNLKSSLITMAATYGFLWGLLEPINALIWNSQLHGSRVYLLFASAAVAVGIVRLYPRTHVWFRLKSTASIVEICFTDLFAEACAKVLPVNDCFDSLVGPVVAPNSLHGMFINRVLGGVAGTFDALVAPSLATSTSTNVDRPIGGKTLRYPIGTTAHVTLPSGGEYYLLALTWTDPATNTANATVAQFWKAAEGLWNTVRNNAANTPVAVPLLGGGLAGVGLPPNQLLNFLITSFTAETKRLHVTARLKIVLHESVFDDVDLGEVKRQWIK